MLVYAEAEFSGVKPHKHGGNESQHIKALRAMGAKIPEDKHEMPSQLVYLMDTFKKVKFSRVPAISDDGKQVFSLIARDVLNYSQLDFYSRNTGLDFEAWEIDALMSLDSIFERAAN